MDRKAQKELFTKSSVSFAFLGACSLTFALPLLGTLGEGGSFFVAHGAESRDILLFAFGVYFLPAVLLISVFMIIRFIINQAAANLFVSLAIGLLVSLWAASHASSVSTAGTIAIGLAAGALASWGYIARSSFRSILKIVGQISPIILIYFLAFTPAKQLIVPYELASYSVAGKSNTPIVMLIFDELSLAGLVTPDGDIDAVRVPNFSRLAQMSTWYRDATTVSTSTHKSVPAILSGMIPEEDALPTLSQYPQNLFTLLADSHDIHALELVSRLCPKSACNKSDESMQTKFNPRTMYTDAGYVWLHAVFPAELAQRYLPPISHGWRDFTRNENSNIKKNDDARFKRERWQRAMLANPLHLKIPGIEKFRDTRIKRFYASIRKSKGADVQFIHMGLPHYPWIRFPDGSIYNGESPPGLKASMIWRDDKNLSDQAILQYALQVEYVDKLLGNILQLLEESGRLNETLLIVLSDHGLAIAPGKAVRIPDASTLADISRIPLFIKYPGQSLGVQDQRKVQTIDIFPTIAQVLDLQLNATVDGQSLVSDDWQAVKRWVVESGKDIRNYEAAMDMRRASERVYRVLAPGKSAMDSFGTQNSRALMGTSVQEYTIGESQLSLQLENSGSYSNIDLKSDRFPARLSGIVEGADLGTELVIAVNNTFAGSGMTYEDQGSISVMLDPRQFQDGDNTLTAYMLSAGELKKLEVLVE
jgi:hypothetical protein